MRIIYFEDTDTTLIQMSPNVPAEAVVVDEFTTIDLDESKTVVRATFEHSGKPELII